MLKLRKHQVAVEPLFDRDQTKSGLWIPDQAKERCDQGIVKSVGYEVDPSIQPGDYVVFSGYAGTTIGLDNDLFILLHYQDIKCVLLPEDHPITIPGLYHKGKIDSDQLVANIRSIVEDFPLRTSKENADKLFQLFAKNYNDLLLEADYDISIKLIKDKFQRVFENVIDVEEFDKGEIREFD